QPVTAYDAGTLERAIEHLREKGLVWVVRGGRAVKYDHRLGEKLTLDAAQTAVLCVLMLRGAQTVGEIRARSGRLHEFGSLEAVDQALESLARHEPPLVTKLPRAPGTKEARFAQLLGGEMPLERDVTPNEASAVVAETRSGE